MSFIGFIAFLIVIGFLLSRGSEIWFLEKQQQSFKETLSTLEDYVSEGGPVWLALMPLQYLTVFSNRYFGESLISRRSFKLTTLLAICLMVSTIWYTVLTNGKGSFAHSPPWKIYKSSMERLRFSSERLIDKYEDEKEKAAADALRKRYQALLTLDSSSWALVYTVIFFVLCGLLTGILTCLSLAITRQILREMLFARGVLTLFGGVIVNVVLVLVLGSSVFLLLFVFSFPSFWPLWELPIWMLTLSALWKLLIYFGSTLLAWILVVDWIKFVVLVSLFPCIFFLVALCFCAVFYFFKKPLHVICLRLLRRSLEWKAGPIAFFAALFTFLTVIIGLLGKHVF